MKKLNFGGFAANCYTVTDDDAIAVIDPGSISADLIDTVNKYKNKAILLTHCHFDHIAGVARLAEATGATVYISKTDNAGLMGSELNLAENFGLAVREYLGAVTLSGGTVKVGNMEFTVIETPGHTAGSVCYKIGNVLYSGDTLFRESIGRTDFISGSPEDMTESLKKLKLLKDETVVYPGHGEETTIAHEKENNPYMR